MMTTWEVPARVGTDVWVGSGVGVVDVVGVVDGDGERVGDGVGVGVGVLNRGTTGDGVGVLLVATVGVGVADTAAIARGVTGANMVTDWDGFGDTVVPDGANLVPDCLAPPVTCLAPGAKDSVTTSPMVSARLALLSPPLKTPPTLAAKT